MWDRSSVNNGRSTKVTNVQVPVKGSIIELQGSLGKIALDTGEMIQIRKSKCGGFEPRIGRSCYVCEVGIDDRFGAVVEATRIATTADFALLKLLDLKIEEEITYDRVRTLSLEERAHVAARVVELLPAASDDHVLKKLLDYLAETSPQTLHPLLDHLDPAQYLHAFRGAPLASLEPYARRLASCSVAPEPYGNAPADQRSEGQAAAVALLALAASADPRALMHVRDYAERTCGDADAREVAEWLLAETGHAFASGASFDIEHVEYDACYELEPAAARSRDAGVMWSIDREHRCGACRQALTRVLHIEAARAPGVRDDQQAIEIAACLGCLVNRLDPYFVRYLGPGNPETVLASPLPADFMKDQPIHPEHEVLVSPREAPPVRGCGDLPGGSYDRIGGRPTWLQPARTIRCPGCERAMTFVAQATEIPDGYTPLLLAFECRRCNIVATTREL